MQNVIMVSVDSIEEKRKVVKGLINQYSNGKIFRAVNIKTDGSLREYRAMIGVTRHVTGAGSTTNHKENLVTIYDMGLASQLGETGILKEGAPYRAFNADTALMLGFTEKGHTNMYLFTDGSINKIADPAIKAALTAAKKANRAASNILTNILA